MLAIGPEHSAENRKAAQAWIAKLPPAVKVELLEDWYARGILSADDVAELTGPELPVK